MRRLLFRLCDRMRSSLRQQVKDRRTPSEIYPHWMLSFFLWASCIFKRGMFSVWSLMFELFYSENVFWWKKQDNWFIWFQRQQNEALNTSWRSTTFWMCSLLIKFDFYCHTSKSLNFLSWLAPRFSCDEIEFHNPRIVWVKLTSEHVAYSMWVCVDKRKTPWI